jgi:hypothetical protein
MFFSMIIIYCNPINKVNNEINDDQNNIEFLIKQDTTSSNMINYTEKVLKLLQGVWAEKKDENALFYIENKNLYYIENQDSPIPISVSKNAFIIMGDIPVKCDIVKLNCDSLIYVDEFSDIPTRLYKRK